MTAFEEDYYKLLEIGKEASVADIKKAFHRLALQNHPDHNQEDPLAAERFRKINDAYKTLKDPELRLLYDQRSYGFFAKYETSIQPYLHAEVNTNRVRLNDEVELTFSFSGEGRFFRKPDLSGWFISSGPVVDHRVIFKDGIKIRETLLSYTVCPLRKGELTISPATISFDHRKYESSSLQLFVEDGFCYFKEGAIAGDNPLKITLHREQVTSNSIYRKINLYRHTVLIPRSDLASWYHNVGRMMKASFEICGVAWALVNDHNIFIGFLAGSLIAGINCQLMYKLMGIKSRFYYSSEHPLVLEYLDNGYTLGDIPSGGLFSERQWYLIKSLFI